MTNDVSIIMCLYNSPQCKIERTLHSIVIQKDVGINLICVDDCSNVDNKTFIDQYLRKYRVKYKYISHNINTGTVITCIDGLREAQTERVCMISPGDFFLDEDSLKSILEYSIIKDADVCFGNKDYYINEGNSVKILSFKRTPQNPDIYCNSSSVKRKVEQYLIVRDKISGAVCIYKRELLLDYLLKLKDKIKYCEDYSILLFMLNNKRICYYNNKIFAYEFGEGVSTSKNKQAILRIVNDENAFYEYLIRNQDRREIRRAYKLYKKENRIFRYLLTLIFFPGAVFELVRVRLFTKMSIEQ